MKSKAKKILSYTITLVSVVVFVYAANGLISTFLDYKNNDKQLTKLQETFYNEASANSKVESNDDFTIRPGFDVLHEENNELIGWLTIENTNVDYPILQGQDNNVYLRRDFYQDYNILGSIFMDFRNNITEFDRNTIIYGHRSKDGSMFETLTQFEDEAFFKENKTFTFDTLYESYEAEIFATYNTTTDFNYIQTDFANDTDYQALLDEISEKALYDTGVEVSVDDHILTLSTCDYKLDKDIGRFVIHAKLTKK